MIPKIVGVVGAGQMGSGIAQVLAEAGLGVLLYDSVPRQVEKGLDAIRLRLEKKVTKGDLTEARMQDAVHRVVGVKTLKELHDAEFVIEAVVEDALEKKKLFEWLAEVVDPSAILASNTSSIPITELAAVTRHPENVIGFHFMNPPFLMPGIEIVRGLLTSDATFDAARELAEHLGKQAVVSKDRAGFVVNRIVMPMINEAVLLVGEGTASIEDIDRGGVACLNHPMGPLALSDTIGNDTTHHILSVMQREHGDRFRPAPLLTRMVEAGMFGRKTSAGFYEWQGNTIQRVNPGVLEFRNAG
ncbi:3-hydroxybutyryl-CoA dehydrogenase [Nitrospina gracilis 3/211]|uniref:3-hydroxybutyryl-CoA dehydrogenase n=1 Tax=Nitrospina gracilis (strain 3/211) TaxID=1266370 RepID=M1ZAZ0_NITG3|nr:MULTISPECIES: 3-hydroxyacyl-CoA dehydrogenase NAD-binding domain-containing protein [Nitrospina]MCF8723395.1 3-hydroxybutyryl-CoA dehydrogenase [Nitrospina sp. Nb-3]CCQ90455.1 3-hydroxybutyryl-CoA dehydrogenase [Nitrospina gracilis 3/211]